MTMQYRRNRNTKRAAALKVLLYTGIIICVVCIDALIGAPLKSALRNVVTPVLSSVHNVTTGRITAYFSSKETLIQQNNNLQKKIALLEQEHRMNGIMQKDAEYFCAIDNEIVETVSSDIPDAEPVSIKRTVQKPTTSLMHDVKSRAYATGRVIAYERVLLGTLIIEFEGDTRPKTGDFVLDDAGEPLGIVDTVHETTATVQLLTLINTTHEVRVGKTVAAAHGRLSNTFIVFIPQEQEVTPGDVVTLTALGVPLGEVVHVERSPADAQVLLYVRPFAQPLQTHFVYFVANPLKEHHE